jgi:hypothetical protein
VSNPAADGILSVIVHDHAEVRSVPELQELCRDGAHWSYGYGNIVIFCSTAEPDSSYCNRNAQATIEYARQHPSGLGMLVLIAADEPPPSEAGRRAIQASYVSMQSVIRAGVLVVEGEGFAAAAKRSAITLISMSSGLPFPMRVTRNPVEGAAKIVSMLGTRLDSRLTVQLVATAASSVKSPAR